MTLDVFHPLDKAENAREILGIHFCETCGVDTMPCERTGECFFCGSHLTVGTDEEPPQPATFVERFCKHGHWMTAANTVTWGGSVRCRACARDTRKRYDERKKAAA